ncbi:MAG: penicillin-binding protein 1C [Marinilabiliales bacterium]|nr:MAG: penicillin-binding protein 1C [Marinilabiliales bacterium]
MPLWLKFFSGGAVLFLLFLLFVPVAEFSDPYSTVIEGKGGKLLGAHIADDGQWRFPAPDSIPAAFENALLTFEDRHFYAHPGVNPVSLFNAFRANINAGEVVRGGSTITMQVVRLSRKGKPRTYGEKLIEIVLAFRLELAKSKREILTMYVAHAPFGGNVVGLEAASWRYFRRPPHELSVAENAMLAVLPNAPAAIHPSRNRNSLQQKRNRLLAAEMNREFISEENFLMALEEPLPLSPEPLPNLTEVLSGRLSVVFPGQKVQTMIDPNLQYEVNSILSRNLQSLEANEIHNLAAVIMDVSTGGIIAYAGNICTPQPEHSPHVDMVVAARSTGSILKPFLYCAMLDDGRLLPDMLVADVPANFSGYTPKNYSETYLGALPAWQALSRSLNVPAVGMLSDYGVGRFYNLMEKAGISTFTYPASHYGLSLILGGAEASLMEISALYCNMARQLNGDSRSWQRIAPEVMPVNSTYDSPFSKAAIYCTFDAMKRVNRPGAEAGWEHFAGSGKIAWKTGTSFGFRDAWAVGVTTKYVVGLWAGNADGEGRPGLTGTSAAAPVMFDLFNLLPESRDFQIPYEEMVEIPLCAQSGHQISRFCTDTIWRMVPENGLKTTACPYHKIIHLDFDTLYRVNSACYPVSDMVAVSWFELPPVQSYYYRRNHAEYHAMPPWRSGCNSDEEKKPLSFVYPPDNREIYLPKRLDGTNSRLILEAAHQNTEETIYWYLDDQYLGATNLFHTMECYPEKGEHRITILDGSGNSEMVNIKIHHRRKRNYN